MSAKVGQRVLYTLGASDAADINRRRTDYAVFWRNANNDVQGEGGRNGHQGHFGNSAAEGDQYPATIVRVFDETVTTANLQVLLDGNDTYWATSRQLGDGPGHYQLDDQAGA